MRVERDTYKVKALDERSDAQASSSGVSLRSMTLALLSAAFFLSLLDRQVLTVLVGPLKHDLGISDTQFGLLQGLAFAVFYIALSLPMGMLADRRNRKLIITGGLFLWSASTCFAGFARTFGWLFGARIGVGLGEACLAPAAYSMFTDLYGQKSIGRVIGVFHAVGALGIGAAAIIGGMLYQRFASLGAISIGQFALPAWGMTLVCVGAPGVVLSGLILLLVREPRRDPASSVARSDDPNRPALIKVVLDRRGTLLRLLLGNSLLALAGNALLTWAPTYLIRIFALSPAEAGMQFGSATAIGAIAGPLLGGVFADLLFKRMGDRGPFVVLAASSALVALCYFGFAVASSAQQVVVVIALVSTVYSAAFAVAASTIQRQTPGAVRAQVSALFLCLNTVVGMGLGALLVGVITDSVFHSLMAVGRSLAIVAIIASSCGAILLSTLLRQSSAMERSV